MNTFYELAENFIDKKVGKEFGIVQKSIKELSDFYCFTYQTRKYLESGKFEDMAVGQGYNFINKSDNRIFEYGSEYSFENALKELRKKISQEVEIKKVITQFDIQKRFDLNISTVLKKQILVDTLLKFRLTYIIPEAVGSSIFRIAKEYEKQLLSAKLADTPITFHGVNQDELPDLIIELLKNSSCEFELSEHIKKNYAKYVDKASALDLEPIW